MENNGDCKAAFAQTDITPDFQVELIGCAREDSRSQGVLHPLCAQVLLLEFGGVRYGLVAVDSLGLTTALSDELRSLAASQWNTSVSNVMIGFSHTHSAPAPLSPVNGERYFRLMRERVQNCAAEAMDRLKPCRAGWTLGDTGIGENRREGCSTIDRRLGALQIADMAGCPLAVVLHVTAHANVLMRHNSKVSSDYFGVAREGLRDWFGCPVMLWQGAAGNIKPVGVDKIGGGDLPDVYRIADMLLDSAKRLRFRMKEVTCLQMHTQKIEYVSDVPDEAEAKQIADQARTLFGIDGSEWLEECARLNESGVKIQVQQGEIQFLYLNEGCLCGVPEEIFCELSLEAAECARSPYLFLNGYTNGCTGYLPHSAEWAKGGYETLFSYLQYYRFHGHVMPFRQDTAKRIVDLVCEDWERTQGRREV